MPASSSPSTLRSPASSATRERGKKLNMAIGMLDHSAGIALAAGAELVVFHPGFLLGREREQALTTSSSRRASCASGWRRKAAACRSGSR